MYGDAFYKIRYGQRYNGMYPESFDRPNTIIEPVDAKKVYPQVSPYDRTKIVAFHITNTVRKAGSIDDYLLYVESHYAGEIVYRKFDLSSFHTDRHGNILTFRIGREDKGYRESEETGVPVPLVVHVPNYTDGTTWQGIDDISEHVTLFDEINNRMSQIAHILDSHADPALAVPTGLLQDDGEGNSYFQVAVNKVFEVMGKDDILPEYITWNGQLDSAFKSVDNLIEFLLSTSEIPNVAIGMQDSGTSGNSGLAIKWRMNSLLAKINRKRQFFDSGLKQVFQVAQMLELDANPSAVDYELTIPVIKFKDGLPEDENEQANIMSIRTGGVQTLSRKTA
ncbi:phage portal protein [Geomicrobium sp. JCM 19055]|uniref:phage portal protein n=1 Tax=Geomicrobium sp. JCM 19055 TaxID=1460649 RepID=UPI000AF98B9C|nr:phage portal protein [Geomicrobium sp. JCM 19055]